LLSIFGAAFDVDATAAAGFLTLSVTFLFSFRGDCESSDSDSTIRFLFFSSVSFGPKKLLKEKRH
jgi:hypothetical protein